MSSLAGKFYLKRFNNKFLMNKQGFHRFLKIFFKYIQVRFQVHFEKIQVQKFEVINSKKCCKIHMPSPILVLFIEFCL